MNAITTNGWTKKDIKRQVTNYVGAAIKYDSDYHIEIGLFVYMCTEKVATYRIMVNYYENGERTESWCYKVFENSNSNELLATDKIYQKLVKETNDLYEWANGVWNNVTLIDNGHAWLA